MEYASVGWTSNITIAEKPLDKVFRIAIFRQSKYNSNKRNGFSATMKKRYSDIFKRKYKNPLVFDATIDLSGHDDKIRQGVVKGTCKEHPSFLSTNDFQGSVDSLVFRCPKRWRI